MIPFLWSQLALADDVFVVRGDESLADLARRAGLPVADLQQANPTLPQRPAAGTLVRVPGVSGTVTVSSVRGKVTLSDMAGNDQRPVAVGAVVSVGERLCTSEAGSATIAIRAGAGADHDDVSLGSGACVRLELVSADPTHRSSWLRVESGQVVVRAADRPGTVVLSTTDGVAVGDVGGFRVEVEQGATRTEAVSGPLSLFGAGVEVAMPAATGSRVVAGEAPSAPVGLLAPGVPENPASGEVLGRPTFTWTPVDRALGYRLEISATPDFSDIVFSAKTASSPYSPDSLLVPFRVTGLYWRLSSFDRTGFQGLPSEPHRLVVPPQIGP